MLWSWLFPTESWRVLLIVLMLGAPIDSDLPEEITKSVKKLKLDDLCLQLQSFAHARLVNGCIETENEILLPYPLEEIQMLFVRKCYEDVFQLFLGQIERGTKSFAISGTPGIGKSLFFVYILFQILNNLKNQSGWKPKRIVYHTEAGFECFDLENSTVSDLPIGTSEAATFVRRPETFYVVDGRHASPLLSSCVCLFLSSPRAEHFKGYVKQRKATVWYFPIWTYEELETCRQFCYADFPKGVLLERYRIYGGVARFMFADYKTGQEYVRKDSNDMETALFDVTAAKGVRTIGNPTKMFDTTHTLLHLIVGNNDQGFPYQYLFVDIASKYVGEQLWDRHYSQMIINLQEMFGGSPNEISRHLFEIYGHRVFSKGGRTLKCRDLQDESSFDFVLDRLDGQLISFGKSSLPQAPITSYHEASDDDSFPAIDSLSGQGMFQFTVAQDHSIRGVQILKRLCSLYSDAKIYFVVPPHRFEKFKKQKFLGKQGNSNSESIPDLKQYVLELHVGSPPNTQIPSFPCL